MDVDWASLFKSFYEKVRIKIACKDPCKIPFERLFEMDKKLYMIGFIVEDFIQESGEQDDLDDGGNDNPDDKGEASNDDEADDLDIIETDKEPKSKNKKETPKGSKPADDTGDLADQSPAVIASMYEHGPIMSDGSLSVGSQEESHSKWIQFIENSKQLPPEECNKLLGSMELWDEEEEEEEGLQEERFELSHEVIKQIKKQKIYKQKQEKTQQVTRNESKMTTWGPTLVERPRRGKKEDGRTCMQKAMMLKQQRNLDAPKVKGEAMDWRQGGDTKDCKDGASMEPAVQRGRKRSHGAVATEAGLESVLTACTDVGTFRDFNAAGWECR